MKIWLIFLLPCAYTALVIEEDDECCRFQKVGDFSYTLIPDDSLREFPEDCQKRCAYSRDGEDNGPDYCMKPGDLPSYCINGVEKLQPISAEMGPDHYKNHGGELCIDDNLDTLCHTKTESNYPWLAIKLPLSNIFKVTIANKIVGVPQYAQRTRNLEVWVSDQKPTTTDTRFSSGKMLGSFAGPGTLGQVIEIKGTESIQGTYVIIQTEPHDKYGKYLDLVEVSVFGY